MSGWMLVMGPCVSCGVVFSFNPHLVPSVRVRGEREPVCRDCIERANARRIANGLPPLEILPGAYDPTEA